MRQSLLFSALCAALLGGLLPAEAQACGGFFCNFQNPVVQAAERVLYIQDNTKITAHIQIAYQGPSQKFSWVLPLSKQPTLGVGSDSIFSALENATAPQYYMQTENFPGCSFQQCMYPMAAGGVDDSSQGGGKNTGGVTVLAKEAVGPYDTVVLQGDSGAAVQKWLTDNGYDQPPATAGLLDVYAKKQFVFLALKLQKDKTDGDLQPIVVTLEETGPCLPIRLTALAANPDMPIIIWTLAQHRAIPKNYLHVQLNPKTIDWFTGGGNYLTVASKAVDQASGHAFLTEFAGPSSLLKGQLAYPGWNTAILSTMAEPGQFLQEMLSQNLPRTSQVQGLIRTFIPKPAAFQTSSDQEFYGCVQSQCGSSCGEPCNAIKAAVAQQPFDAKAFAKALQDGVVGPLVSVQGAFDTVPYLTRMFTLVSPEEMGKDPIFGVNADLPDVAREHKAIAMPICSGGSKYASQAKLMFEDGSDLTVDVPKQDTNMGMCYGYGYYGNTSGDKKGPLVAAGGQPAKQVEVLDEAGAPVVIDPTVADLVDAQLNAAQLGAPSLSADYLKTLPKVTWNPSKVGAPGASTTSPAGAVGASGCSSQGRSAHPGAWLALGLLALGLLWRRRQAA